MLKLNTIVFWAVVASTLTTITATPHSDDPLTPIIRFLKAVRRANRYSSYNRNDDGLDSLASASSQSQSLNSNNNNFNNNNNNNNNNFNRDPVVTTEFLGQRPQGSSSNSGNSNNFNSNRFSSADQIQRIIQQSQQSSSNNNNNNNYNSNNNNNNNRDQGSLLGQLGNLNLNGLTSAVAGTSVPPARIEQINRGVSTILGGVGSGSLERILRGSFMFTRNENVVKVANNVLDSIFGKGGGSK